MHWPLRPSQMGLKDTGIVLSHSWQVSRMWTPSMLILPLSSCSLSMHFFKVSSRHVISEQSKSLQRSPSRFPIADLVVPNDWPPCLLRSASARQPCSSKLSCRRDRGHASSWTERGRPPMPQRRRTMCAAWVGCSLPAKGEPLSTGVMSPSHSCRQHTSE